MDRAEVRRAQVYGARDALQNPGFPQPPRAGARATKRLRAPIPPVRRLLYHFALSTVSAVCRAPVAQLDRVTVSEAVGRGFESRRARHFLYLHQRQTAGENPRPSTSGFDEPVRSAGDSHAAGHVSALSVLNIHLQRERAATRIR